MLTAEQNELLSRVEGNAPMGALMKRYWLPACLASEVEKPGGAPVRARLIGIDLVVYRGPDNKLGALYEFCPHRRVSLALARNEACGLRCLYHGWKFDTEGTIIEMPTEAPGSRAKERLRHDAFPAVESGGLIWVYLGPKEAMRPFQPLPWSDCPPQRLVACKLQVSANWAQAFEGQMDSAHSSMLHSADILTDNGALEDGAVEAAVDVRPSGDPNPKLFAKRVPYGMRYVAVRQPVENADTQDYMRVTVFIAPCFAIIPSNRGAFLCTMTVPRDNNSSVLYVVQFSDHGDVNHEKFRATLAARPGIDFDPVSGLNVRNKANNFLQDREAMARGNFSGIEGIGPQDLAMWESMAGGEIVDRSGEHLGSTDLAVVQFRRVMLDAVEQFVATSQVLGQDSLTIPLAKVRGFEGTVAKGSNWEVLGQSPEELALNADYVAAAAE